MASNRLLAPILFGTAANGPSISWGTGSPESSVTANVGSIYLRDDGGSGTSIYFKETGDGTNTGWVAVNPTVGASGYSGYSGTSGFSGYSGPSGFSGYSGTRGLRWQGIWGDDADYLVNDLVVGNPLNDGNPDGNTYICTVAHHSSGSIWPGVSVGWQSYWDIFSSASSGYSGYSGKSGFSGYSGTGSSGFSGYSGPSGFSGYSGPSGFSGYSGPSGFSGYSGRSGFSGYSGPSGFSGYSALSYDYLGQWTTSTVYALRNVVVNNGNTYICKLAHTSSASDQPGVGASWTTYWDLSAASGYSGYSGRSGYSGYSGLSGFSGYSGISGFSGYSGPSGFSGYSGRSGYSGYSAVSGFSGYSGGGTGTPGGSPTQIQFHDTGTVFAGDADLVWDKTNNSVNISQSAATWAGQSSPHIAKLGNLTINQSTSTNPAILLTGNSADTSNDTQGGIAMYMTHNGAGNRQFVIGASENVGSASASVFRYLTGSGIATLDGITGNGGTRCPVNLGTDTSSVAIGNNGLAYNASLPAKATIYAEAGGVGLQINLGSSGTTDLARFANNGGTALSVVSSAGKIGAVNTSPTAYLHLGAGTSSANTAPLKFTAGTNLATLEGGAVEYDGARLMYSTDALMRHALVGCVFTQVKATPISVNGSQGETSVLATGAGEYVGNYTFPANFFKKGKTVRFTIRGYITVATSLCTLNPKIKLGTSVIDSNSASPGLSVTTNQAFLWTADGTFYEDPAAGADCWCQGFFFYGDSNSTFVYGFGRENTAIVDCATNGSLAADVTFTWGGGAGASDIVTVTNLIIEVLN